MAECTLICRRCKLKIKDESPYCCPACGAALDCQFDLTAERERLASVLKAAHSFWDYAPFFPVDPRWAISLGEGYTPLLRAKQLAAELGVAELMIKNEGMNPTGTFKDRCMSLALAKALELGAAAVVLGSAGNAGSAAAAYAARAELPCYVLLPDSTPIERAAQAIIYGARLISVRGTTSECIKLVGELSHGRGWHNVTTAAVYNPYQGEAAKSIAYEIAQAMDWSTPDWVLAPVGGGGLLSGIYKGYCELLELGLVSRLPRLAGVQAAGCAPVVKAFLEDRAPGEIESWKHPSGIAGAIACSYPLDGASALAAIYESTGYSELVSDEEILKAQSLLARSEGVFAESASATTVAALAKLLAKGIIKKGERVVCILTGTGLKELQQVAGYLQHPPVVEPEGDQIDRVLAEQKWCS